MSSLSDAQKASLIRSTRPAAIALAEDLIYVRKTFEVYPPAPDTYRRLSPILRRLLLEADLRIVAGPRVGRISILTPKPSPGTVKKSTFYHQEFGFNFLGCLYPAAITLNEDEEASSDTPSEPNSGGSRDLDYLVSVHLQEFLSQRPVYFRGDWFTRKQLLSYASNIAGGVHSGTPKSKDRVIFAKIEEMIKNVGWEFGHNCWKVRHKPTSSLLTHQEVNPVTADLISTARMLVAAPQINSLVMIIQKEMGMPPLGLFDGLP